MRITIFGASGRVGRLVVKEALGRGHSVVAFVHSTTPFGYDPQLQVVKGDIHSARAVAGSLQHSQAVISTLGSWGRVLKGPGIPKLNNPKDIVSAGMRTIIPAMEAQGIARIVSLTGTEAFVPGEKSGILRYVAHFAARLGAGKILKDGEDHIKLLHNSTLDWTVIRSPVMTRRPAITYRLTLTPLAPWQAISRQAVAKAMMDQVEGPGYLRAAPFIYQR